MSHLFAAGKLNTGHDCTQVQTGGTAQHEGPDEVPSVQIMCIADLDWPH